MIGKEIYETWYPPKLKLSLSGGAKRSWHVSCFVSVSQNFSRGEQLTADTNSENIAIRAVELHRAGFLHPAKNAFISALDADPDNLIALYSVASIYLSIGSLNEADRAIDRFLEKKMDFALAHIVKSKISVSLGKIELAKQSAHTALSVEPTSKEARQLLLEISKIDNESVKATSRPDDHVSAHSLAGLKAQDLGDIPTEEHHFQLALQKNPEDYHALYSLGVMCWIRGDIDKSIDFLQQATNVAPNSVDTFFAYGTSLMSKGLWEKAQETLTIALNLNPNHGETRVNLSNLLHSMRRPIEALTTLNLGLEIEPNNQKLLNNKGYILTDLKQYSLAADTFKKLATLNPNYENALGLLAHAKLHACDWNEISELKEKIIEEVSRGNSVTQPFALMSLTDNPQIIRNCAKIFGSQRFPLQEKSLWRGEKYKHRKKRVAFLSGDFREHAVGYLFREILDRIDPAKYETIAIHSGAADKSDVYNYYKRKFNHYISAESKTSKELAEILKVFETDIAIDLSGYTSGSRLDVLSHRPAPIQISYLGYPGTLALPYIDYLIADKVTIPEGEEHNYSERILRLNSCYLPTSERHGKTYWRRTKYDHGLPSEGTVFCSFNHDYKINQPMFSTWMSLLHADKNSCLWLMKLNEDAQANLKSAARSHDIDPERLIFATRVKTLDEHLERYTNVDVCLDTFPYNGHTTTFDALSMGVNVISMAGKAFQSRVAASLLTDYGLTENIATTLDEYSMKALQAREKKQMGSYATPCLQNDATAESKGQSFNSVLDSLFVLS